MMSDTGDGDFTPKSNDLVKLFSEIEKNHKKLYKIEKVFLLDFTIGCWFFFLILYYFYSFITLFLLTPFTIYSYYFENKAFDSDLIIDYSNILSMASFAGIFFPGIALIETLCSLGKMKQRKLRNKIVEDFFNGNFVILEYPKWIEGIGIVNKLHEEDKNLGTTINFSANKFKQNEYYFLTNLSCKSHKNHRGTEHHTYYERNHKGELVEHSYTTYYYYQTATFEIEGQDIKLLHNKYSPAFDTAEKYDVLFKINKADSESVQYSGEILKLFLQDGSGGVCPGGKGGDLPISSSMNFSNNKAVVA